MNKPNPEKICEAIMENLLKDGFSYQVPKLDVEKAIWHIRGSNHQTVKTWKQILTSLGYLRQINRNIYEMNVAKIPGLFQLLRNIPQTHLTSAIHIQSSINTNMTTPPRVVKKEEK